MIDLSIHPEGLDHAVQRAREKHILIPTFAQMRDPSLVPARVRERLSSVGLWDLDPLNLFRIPRPRAAATEGSTIWCCPPN